MIIFIDTKAFADFLHDIIKSGVEHDLKIQKQREIEYAKKQKLKEQKRLEKMKKEEEEHLLYYRQYLEDPTSMMICPFGWSPFGIYL